MAISWTSRLPVGIIAGLLFLSSYTANGWKVYSPPPPKGHGHGDPHFTGADSSHFEFSGVPNTSYCLLSDSHVHVNAYFGGYYGQYEQQESKSITWMRVIGVLWGHHSIVFRAREGPEADYLTGYMAKIEVDGQLVALSAPGDSASFGEGGKASITWLSAKERSGDDFIDTFSLDIRGVLSMILELRPEVPHFRTETDGTVHFDVYFPHAHLSDNVHGILGQTYRPDHVGRISKMRLVFNSAVGQYVVPGENGEGFLDGTVVDYETSSILAADCAVNRFARLAALDSETSLAMEISSGGVPSVLGSSSAPRSTSGTSTSKRLRRFKLMKFFRLL